MDTVSAFVPGAFCTGCCKPWRDIDIVLDLMARAMPNHRDPATRLEAFRRADTLNVWRRGACCRRALFPAQRNIQDLLQNAFTHSGTILAGEIGTSYSIATGPPRLGSIVNKEVGTDAPIPRIQNLSELEKLL